MSTFICPLVQIQGFGKHKNADTLCVTGVEGTVCIFKEGTYQKGDLAVLVPVDALVPVDTKTFEWLKDPKKPNATTHRVKARRLRGVFSDGLLVPMMDLPSATVDVNRVDGKISVIGHDGLMTTFKLGDDLSTFLGITKAEDQAPAIMNGDQEYGPDVPVYDIEPWKKFKHVFENEDEQVVITEKLHGTNSRFTFMEGRLWVGSRNRFLRIDERNLWWNIAAKYELEAKLKQVPGLVLYGETYGDVQDLKYGSASGERAFAAFDIYDTKTRQFLDYETFKTTCEQLGIPMVPVLYVGPIGNGVVVEGLTNPEVDTAPSFKSALDDKTIREGVVVKPTIERWNHYTHRTILKNVSQAYLLRKGGTELH